MNRPLPHFHELSFNTRGIQHATRSTPAHGTYASKGRPGRPVIVFNSIHARNKMSFCGSTATSSIFDLPTAPSKSQDTTVACLA